MHVFSTGGLHAVTGGRLPESLCSRGVQLRQAGDNKSTGPEGTGEAIV